MKKFILFIILISYVLYVEAQDKSFLVGEKVMVVDTLYPTYVEKVLKKFKFKDKYLYKELRAGSVVTIVDVLDCIVDKREIKIIKANHNGNRFIIPFFNISNSDQKLALSFYKHFICIDSLDFEIVNEPKKDYHSYIIYINNKKRQELEAKEAREFKEIAPRYQRLGINADSINLLLKNRMVYMVDRSFFGKMSKPIKVDSYFYNDYIKPTYVHGNSRYTFTIDVDSAYCEGIKIMGLSGQREMRLIFSKEWQKKELFNYIVEVPLELFTEDRQVELQLNLEARDSVRQEIKLQKKAFYKSLVSAMPDEYETRLNVYKVAKSVFGEETAQLMRKGEVRFGWTKDMCTMARCTDEYKIGRVSSDIGWIDYYHYINLHRVYYFLDDKLIGIYDFSGVVKWVEELQSALKGFKVSLK